MANSFNQTRDIVAVLAKSARCWETIFDEYSGPEIRTALDYIDVDIADVGTLLYTFCLVSTDLLGTLLEFDKRALPQRPTTMAMS